MKKFFISALLLIILFASAVYFIDPKRPSARDYTRIPSQAISREQDTSLRRIIAPDAAAHAGESGLAFITSGSDSLELRLAMIEAAERSLDIQYYIMEDDVTGKLLLEAILRAADRGVRVRILMDDMNVRGRDTTWPLLNNHPNIEIRIFNPFATQDEPFFTRISDLFTGWAQFSRRMHNKILVVDNQAGITGGRNLGDEYFDASSDFNFRDIDVLAIGPVVASLSQSFDDYWNGDETYPLAALHTVSSDKQAMQTLRQQLQQHWQAALSKKAIPPQNPLFSQLQKEQVNFTWAQVELVADAASKVDMPHNQAVSKPALMLNALAQHAQKEFIIVSSYFVPDEGSADGLIALARKQVAVKVLTNSLASSDGVAAHTGYRRYREALIEGGVEVYELKPVRGANKHSHRFSSSTRNSLHSKIYVLDRRDVVVGSFNLDPRSVHLNTEMVLVIHSPELAQQVLDKFEKAIVPTSSFHVVMKDGHLLWLGQKDGEEQDYTTEPQASLWRKLKADIFALLPLEDQL